MAIEVLRQADARRGFLFVDELFTLPAVRRRGVASALLRHLRLLARPDNGPARRLYRQHGLSESPTLFRELSME